MKTVILCGGYGTRIRDVADNIPKPMIPVGGLPILWHIMKYYAHAGHKDFVLCLGYKSNSIKDFFLNFRTHVSDFSIALNGSKPTEFHDAYEDLDWRVTCAETGLKAMTGARIRRIKKYVEKDDHFMLTYGDGLGDVDLAKLIEFHKKHGKAITVTGVRPPGRFGELMTNQEGRVTEFNEKPQATGGRISGGFFVCRREIFEYLNDDESLVFEKEPMAKLVEAGQLMMFEHDGFWQPMDTYREYELLNGLFEKGTAPWMVWKKR